MNSQIIKYLYANSTQLATPKYKAIFTPTVEWRQYGHVLGNSIAQLNFPDNSVIFMTELEEDGDDFYLPEQNTQIVLPNSPNLTNQIMVDNTVLSTLKNAIPNSFIQGSAFFEKCSHPFVPMPFVTEISRIRKRGVPLCTPVLFQRNCDIQKLSNVLQYIIEKNGVGIVITDNNINYDLSNDEINQQTLYTLSSSLLIDAFAVLLPSYPHVASLQLLSYLAHRFHSQVEIAASGRTVQDGKVYETLTLGISKNNIINGFSFNNINIRRKIWGNVVAALKGYPTLPINYPCAVVLQIRSANGKEIFFRDVNIDSTEDLGASIWKAAQHLFEDFEELTDDMFIDVLCLDDFTVLNSPKALHRNETKGNIIITNTAPLEMIMLNERENIARFIKESSVDADNCYITKPFIVSLPLLSLLDLHDIDYPFGQDK